MSIIVRRRKIETNKVDFSNCFIETYRTYLKKFKIKLKPGECKNLEFKQGQWVAI